VTCNLPIPPDALLAMELVEGALAGGGEVEYPDIFKALF
jgi:hypothetical protein